MQTYLFYDIETTGLNKSFDQVLQFAAIRTDLNLRELERHEFLVKLNPDVIPAPRAVITHQIGIAETQAGIPEIDAIKQIHALLNTPGTISLGYNTLGFDDEFLRFSFYRNLLTPYTHQYANLCNRMDLYPITVMFFLYKNHVLQWPEKHTKITLKLEEINKKNQLATGQAHNAMVDVEVTLALAERFIKEKEMWGYLLGCFNKQIDYDRLRALSTGTALMIDGFFGGEQCFQAPVLSLGQHHHYKNQTVWLRLDSTTLMQTKPDTVRETTRAINKKMGEPSFILPQKERFMQHLLPERLELALENQTWLNQQPTLFQHIQNHHLEYKYPAHPATDIDAALYMNGFWERDEELFCRRFHAANVDEKVRMTEQLQNPRLKSLATRLLGRHYSDKMTQNQIADFSAYLQQVHAVDDTERLVDFRGEKRLTAKAALQEIVELRGSDSLSPKQLQLLEELEIYLKTTS